MTTIIPPDPSPHAGLDAVVNRIFRPRFGGWPESYELLPGRTYKPGGAIYDPGCTTPRARVTYPDTLIGHPDDAYECIGILMYLVARGVIHEAAASGRRALEYLGMAAHLVRDPGKAQFLTQAETESPQFKKAFIRGDHRDADRLKQEGIRYRFSGMSAGMAKAATDLHEIFSRFNVHGGTLSSLVSVAVVPTRNSCGFHNRSLEQVAKSLPLFKPITEITAVELMDLVGRHGTRNKRINEAGACVMVWLDRKDPRWLERLQMVREDLGLVPHARPN